MTIGPQNLELIKKEVASIRDFYNARINADVPTLKEESGRMAARVSTVPAMWRQGEKAAILAKYGGTESPWFPYGKYQVLDLLDLVYMRSPLNAQMCKPLGLNPRIARFMNPGSDRGLLGTFSRVL